MRIQKIIKIGNSTGVILPMDFIKSAKLKVGDKMEIEADNFTKSILITPKKFKSKTMKQFEFYSWLNEYTEKNKELLKALANH